MRRTGCVLKNSLKTEYSDTPSSGRMNNYRVRSYRDIIVITKFAITKFAIRRASKAESIVMY